MTEGIVAWGGRLGKEVGKPAEGSLAREAFRFLEDAVAEALSSAAALASRLPGFAVNGKWMERASKRLGSEMASEGAEAAAPSETMCCGIDGTGVPVRPGEASESRGRDGGEARAKRRSWRSAAARRYAGHVEANRARMRYPAFRAAGPPVGSGVVESACDTVAGRLKRGGMRWRVEGGANPVPTLRCWWLDDRYDGFFKARARPPPMALAA